MDVRELFHCLLNIDDNRSCLPKVREFVDSVLAAARQLQQTADAFAFMDNIRPFDYDEKAFDARMKDIYDDCADFAFTEKVERHAGAVRTRRSESQSLFPHARKRDRAHPPAHAVQFPRRLLAAEHPSRRAGRRGQFHPVHDPQGGAGRRRAVAKSRQHLSRPLPLVRLLSAADAEHRLSPAIRLSSIAPSTARPSSSASPSSARATIRKSSG